MSRLNCTFTLCSCKQQRLCRDCLYAQAGLSLGCSPMQQVTKFHLLTGQLFFLAAYMRDAICLLLKITHTESICTRNFASNSMGYVVYIGFLSGWSEALFKKLGGSSGKVEVSRPPPPWKITSEALGPLTTPSPTPRKC